jgi:hypothetical protein
LAASLLLAKDGKLGELVSKYEQENGGKSLMYSDDGIRLLHLLVKELIACGNMAAKEFRSSDGEDLSTSIHDSGFNWNAVYINLLKRKIEHGSKGITEGKPSSNSRMPSSVEVELTSVNPLQNNSKTYRTLVSK